jgi:predicted extracellular nuclease
MTLNEVKTLIRTTSTDLDSFISAELPLLEDYVKTYCNDDFLVETSAGSTSYYTDMPLGVKRYIARKIKSDSCNITGVMSESLGDYSVSYGNTVSDPLLALLNPYRKVGFV